MCPKSSIARSHFCDLINREAKEIVPGVKIRTFWADKMLVSIVDLDKNAVVPYHSHPEEQAGTVLSGELELTIDGEVRLLKPGDTYLIPGGIEHGAKTNGNKTQALDVFSPVRKDYQY